MKNELQYPFLLKCCNYIIDPFWKSVFINLAYGTTPHGVFINKGYIMCSYKEKEFSYKLDPQKDVYECYTEIMALFKKKLGLISPQEILKNQDELHSKTNDKKKISRDILIENFIIDMRKQYDLTFHQCRGLLTNILTLFKLNIFTTGNLVMENDHIVEINGLNFKNKKYFFDKIIIQNCDKTSSLVFQEDNTLSKEWHKHMTQLKKIKDID